MKDTYTVNQTVTPEQIADALGTHHPTVEQAQVIAANNHPRLVIAGAGSGKTATMADRVAWLVANGHAQPEQILGVTFTRKAAGELAERISAKVRALSSVGLIPNQGKVQPHSDPTVATYHSYAQSLVREHGLRLGVESDSELISQARTTMIIRDILDTNREYFRDFSGSTGTLISAIAQLSSESAEHLVAASEAEKAYRRFETDIVAPVLEFSIQKGRGKKAPIGALNFAARIKDQQLIAAGASLFQQYKQDHHLLDFGDLVRYAAELATQFPDVSRIEKEKYKYVLLDEFQDTSHAQLELFAKLFGQGHPVMAVGDPNQSIYGFRGASAGQLASFRYRFPRISAEGKSENSELSYLTYAWRNTHAVLEVANTLVDGFSAVGEVPLEIRRLQAPNRTQPGLVELGTYLNDEEEAEAIAERLVEQRTLFLAEQKNLSQGQRQEPTMAVLLRNHKQAQPIITALEKVGLEYAQLSLTGLLDTPEIRDLRAVLAILADPMNNDGILRLLTGSKYMLGIKDMVALHTWSKRTQRVERSKNTLSFQDDDHAVSLSEAIDKIRRTEGEIKPEIDVSEEGLSRIRHFGHLLQRFHSYPKHDLAALIRYMEQELGLDVELLANPKRPTATARGNIEAFMEIARDFQISAGTTDLASFMSWIELLIKDERGGNKVAEEPKPGAVQILTTHASKGLEWDLVVVAALNEGGLSEYIGTADQWITTLGMLPWQLRGDKENLPVFQGSPDPEVSWSNWKKQNIEFFKEEVKAHLAEEERRLAYVAMTRARSYLLLTNHHFSGRSVKPKKQSTFFKEAANLAESSQFPIKLLTPVEIEIDETTNPKAGFVSVNWWPQDPFDPVEPIEVNRAELLSVLPKAWVAPATPTKDGLRKAAALISAGERQEIPDTELGHRVQFMLDRLRQQKVAHQKLQLPESINPSTIVQLAKNPAYVFEQWRRPMPEKPSKQARRGNVFHSWVENHYGFNHLLDLEEVQEFDDASLDASLELGLMKENFLASRFANATPAAVEVAIQTALAGITVPSRIDVVFTTPDGAYELVDWKTGRVPTGQELHDNSMQMALYRIGWSRLKNVPLEKVRGSFFYVQHNQIIDVTELVEEKTLNQLLAQVSAAAQQ